MIEQREVRRAPGEQPIIPVTVREIPSRDDTVHEASRWITGEPSVQDLLRDPLIHAVLKRDGLGLQDLLQAISLGRSRLLSAPAAQSTASDAA